MPAKKKKQKKKRKREQQAEPNKKRKVTKMKHPGNYKQAHKSRAQKWHKIFTTLKDIFICGTSQQQQEHQQQKLANNKEPGLWTQPQLITNKLTAS